MKCGIGHNYVFAAIGNIHCGKTTTTFFDMLLKYIIIL